MKFYLVTGYGNSNDGHKESWMMAEEDAYSRLEEGLEEWLADNMPHRYNFTTNDMTDRGVWLQMFVEFRDETDAMAYKLRWE